MKDQIDFDLADILAESREWLVENGWDTGEFRTIENEYGDEDEYGEAEIVNYEVTGYCAMGAVLYSQHIDEEDCSTDPRTLAVALALAKALDILEHNPKTCTRDGVCTCVINQITTWNDAQTEPTPILDTFMKAEKDARSGNVAMKYRGSDQDGQASRSRRRARTPPTCRRGTGSRGTGSRPLERRQPEDSTTPTAWRVVWPLPWGWTTS